MSGRVVILGGAGRLGYELALAFGRAGWDVASVVRSGSAAALPAGVQTIRADASDPDAIRSAARGANILVHATNPPYTRWRGEAMPLAEAAIAGARATGALMLFPGNVYGFGESMPPILDEGTPQRPSTRKGRIRVAIERRIAEEASTGLRAAILYAGDFFGGSGRGSWFDLVIAKHVAKGRVSYPGPLDAVHAWAYLPDLAQTFVEVAEHRDALGSFTRLCFPGHAPTGAELVASMSRAVGRPLRTRNLPWWAFRLLGPFVPSWWEIAEMEYLWRIPHRLYGARLEALIGPVPHTPLDEAVAAALDQLNLRA